MSYNMDFIDTVRPQNVNPEPHLFEAVVSDTSDATQQRLMFETFCDIVLSGGATDSSAAYWPQVKIL